MNKISSILKNIILAVLLVLLIFGVFKVFFNNNDSSETYITTTIKNLEKTQEVVLLNASLEKIVASSNDSKLPFTDIKLPFTEKKSIFIVNYFAKFGIKDAVKIEEDGEDNLIITVPEFDIIGISLNEEMPYQLYDTSKDIFSFVTSDIDTGGELAKQLSNEEQRDLIDDHQNILKEAAEEYYYNIFRAINENIKIKFLYK